MDHFGIGAAVRGALNVYFHSARQTGRTTSLVESVKDGDRIVFLTHQEANRVQQLCRDRGVKVNCKVVAPRDLYKLLRYGSSEGRTLFDHAWVEYLYKQAVEGVTQQIDFLERETSGCGGAHRKTKEEELVWCAEWR